MLIGRKGLCAVKGFEFSGIAISKNKKNIGLVYSNVPNTYGAAVYTRSDILAAPVILSKRMDSQSDRKRAVLINSGDANSFTGKQGIADAESCITTLSNILNINKSECYIGSTGVIGTKLEMNTILSSIEKLVEKLHKSGDLDFAHAIMTTDTKPKQASITFKLDETDITIAACAKGSGMIMPDMATMLCVIISDACISQKLMQETLRYSVEDTLNCISVDGDTSTNDSVFFLTNGVAGNRKIKSKDKKYEVFCKHLKALLQHISIELIKDAEGMTKFITIEILNASSREKARSVARSIANSPLVKTAFYGEDFNWGRILMAIGKAQTRMDCNIIDLYINNYKIINNGEPETDTQDYKKAKNSIKNKKISILVDFHQGDENIKVWTCDLSIDYVKLNAHYTT